MTDEEGAAGQEFLNNLLRINQEQTHMATKIEQERARAVMAQNMKAAFERIKADWPMRLHAIRLQAKTARARIIAAGAVPIERRPSMCSRCKSAPLRRKKPGDASAHAVKVWP